MKKTRKALASLAIAGMVLTMVPFNAFAINTVPTTRLAGTTAAQTAVAIADQTGWTGTAIIASSASYGASDALTAGPLATLLKAPILLQEPGAVLNADTKAELIKLKVTKVYVTSGNAVISQAVLDQLTEMGITIESLGGADRFETSVNIAKKLISLGTPITKVAVANGWQNQDALSIASIASYSNEPIILTQKTGLSASAKAFLADNKGITASDVIGGTGVIDNQVLAQLPNPTRHAGVTAYDTNSQVIRDFASEIDFNNLYLANGVTGIDALTGAPLAAQTKSAIVLMDRTILASVLDLLKENLLHSSVIIAFGGVAVVPENVRVTIVPVGSIPKGVTSSTPTIYSASGIKLDNVIKESGIKTDDGNPVTFKLSDDHTVLIHGVDNTIIGNLKLSVIDGDLYPTFDNSTGDIKIILYGSDEGENGTIRLTVNKLSGEDVNGVPGDATSVGSQNISVVDLAN